MSAAVFIILGLLVIVGLLSIAVLELLDRAAFERKRGDRLEGQYVARGHDLRHLSARCSRLRDELQRVEADYKDLSQRTKVLRS